MSPRGLSTSVGFGPLRATIGPHGPAITARIPGSGIAFRHALGTPHGSRVHDQTRYPEHHPEQTFPVPPAAVMEKIKSAGSADLTTEGLTEFKRLLEQTQREHSAIVMELDLARIQESRNKALCTSWEKRWFLRRILKSKYEKLCAAAEESTTKCAELEEQERLAILQTQIEVPEKISKAFNLLCDEFANMAKSLCIWDSVGQRSANQILDRTTAARIIDRRIVKFQLGKCAIIDTEGKVPHLDNANGGDIYLFPAFAVYFNETFNFAILEYRDITLDYSLARFVESDSLPRDATIIGHTWTKTNVDGSPDKRFKGNRQIPIAQYGKLTLKSSTGMNEEYLVSNAESASAFTLAWKALVKAIQFVE